MSRGVSVALSLILAGLLNGLLLFNCPSRDAAKHPSCCHSQTAHCPRSATPNECSCAIHQPLPGVVQERAAEWGLPPAHRFVVRLSLPQPVSAAAGHPVTVHLRPAKLFLRHGILLI